MGKEFKKDMFEKIVKIYPKLGKQEIFLGLGVSEHEHDKIGPIFSNEDDVKKWIEKCKDLASKMFQEHEKDPDSKKFDKITKKYEKLFLEIDGDRYADGYEYIKKTIDSIKL